MAVGMRSLRFLIFPPESLQVQFLPKVIQHNASWFDRQDFLQVKPRIVPQKPDTILQKRVGACLLPGHTVKTDHLGLEEVALCFRQDLVVALGEMLLDAFQQVRE